MEKEKLLTGLEEWGKIAQREELHSLEKKLKLVEEDLQGNLMVMVSGEFNAGKSTFINALLGAEFLAADITPATAVITKLTYGEVKKVIAHYQDGRTAVFEPYWLEQLTAERSGSGEEIRWQLSFVEYQLPSELLKTYTIIDSPGLTALHEHHTRVTEDFMERNEMGIWLFHALSVGTASEMGWLQQMQDMEVPVLGVVNAIDLLDEEEDIDSFLEFNERRMQPLIQKLYGISARDILQGKMEGNAQLLEWGNSQAIDELFEEIAPVHLRKMEGFYRKLQKPLAEYLHHLQEKKNSFAFLEDTDKMWTFQIRHFPDFMEQVEKVRLLESKLVGYLESWRKFIEERRLDKDFTSQVIKKLGSPSNLADEWSSSLKLKISSHRRREASLLQERTRLMRERKDLDDKWISIKFSMFKLSNKLKFSDQEALLNKETKAWNNQVNNLNQDSHELEQAVGKFNLKARKRLEKNIEADREAYKEAIADLREIRADMDEEYGSIQNKNVEDFQRHLKNHNEFLEKVPSLLKAKRLMVSQLSSYKKAMGIVGDMEKVYAHMDYTELAGQLSIFSSFVEQKPDLSQIPFKAVDEAAFKPIDYSELPITQKQNTREILDTRKTLIRWRVAAAALAMLILSYPSLSSVDWESGWDRTVNALEGTDDNFEEPTTEWQMDEFEEDIELEIVEAETLPSGEADSQLDMPVFMADEATIVSFMQSFRAAYLEDLNHANVTELPKYISQETNIYSELAGYIESLEGKGLYYDFHSIEVLSIEEVGVNLFSVITDETYTISSVEEASYKERTKEYLVDTIADYQFLIRDILTLEQSSELVDYSETEEVAEEDEIDGGTIGLAAETDVVHMMENFYMDLESAFNGVGFETIAVYFAEDGPGYAQTEAYISNAIEKSMWMKNHGVWIESVEVYDSSHYVTTLYVEDEYLYEDGTGDRKEVSAEYLLQVTEEGELKIEELLNLEILSETEI